MNWLTWFIFLLFFYLVVLKLLKKFSTGWCRSQTCLVGKTAIVTGANTGIGLETAIDFAKRGARVILACRDKNKAKKAVEKIIQKTDNTNVSYKTLDLASLKSVRDFAKDIIETEPKLDILVNNAGTVGLTGETQDGLHVTMQINYFGHFLLTNLLLDLLKKSGPSRIVNLTSYMANKAKPLDFNNLNDSSISVYEMYRKSKLCNILFTIELNARLRGSGVTTYSVHPGAVHTEIMRSAPKWHAIIFNSVVWLFYKSSLEGAQTTIYCSVQKGIEYLSGEIFHDCQYRKRYETVTDYGLAKKLWEKSEQLVKLDRSSF